MLPSGPTRWRFLPPLLAFAVLLAALPLAHASADPTSTEIVAPSGVIVSLTADRSSPQDIETSTLSGSVYVYMDVPRSVRSVTYYFDDPFMTGTPYRTSGSHPFDLAGANGNLARPFDTTVQADDSYTLTAVLEYANRRTQVVHAPFRVQNEHTQEPAPKPDPEPDPDVGDDSASATLTWRPPDTAGYTTLSISTPGVYNLMADVDYVIAAPKRIEGAVHIRGGRNVVWIGGHIHIPHGGSKPLLPTQRRGLVVSDMDDQRGDPTRYGYSVDGRVVHIEGLLIDGPDLAEGINTNAPKAIVQILNVRVDTVHFRNSDERDGTNGWVMSHPDIIQTWGAQRELRVDGLTGVSAYQGLYLSEATSTVKGHMRLRRVNLRADEHLGDDDYRYAGHRLITLVANHAGTLHLDNGTVWVQHHKNSGWNLARTNPAPNTAFWRVRYWDSASSAYVDEPPPGDAVFTDAFNIQPASTGTDLLGFYGQWSHTQMRGWDGVTDGRVYSGSPPSGDYVPASAVGLGYSSPGYSD